LRKWLHFLGLQGAWFAAALLATTRWHLFGALANFVFVALHLWFAPRFKPEMLRVTLAVALGFCVEWLNATVGGVATRPAPVALWIVSLWPAFASALMQGHSMAWLADKPWRAVPVGALLGPLGYWGGARLGALSLDGWRSLAVLCVNWAIALFILAAFERSIRPRETQE
jgi:Protein of unknown function (DUF2878)